MRQCANVSMRNQTCVMRMCTVVATLSQVQGRFGSTLLRAGGSGAHASCYCQLGHGPTSIRHLSSAPARYCPRGSRKPDGYSSRPLGSCFRQVASSIGDSRRNAGRAELAGLTGQQKRSKRERKRCANVCLFGGMRTRHRHSMRRVQAKSRSSISRCDALSRRPARRDRKVFRTTSTSTRGRNR